MQVRKSLCNKLLLFLILNPSVDFQIHGSCGWAQSIAQEEVREQSDVTSTRTVGRDVFADIGERDIASRRERLMEVRPPRLPHKMLANGKSDPRAAFTPLAKFDTPEKLSAELARQRRLHAQFLEDFAPALPSFRESVPLEHFQWRLETDADRDDFQHTLSGAGDWTVVKIPHFGGPIGRAVAYYRTVFQVTRSMLDRGAVFVRFGAVDYKAHVFVNGHYLGSHEGFFAPFEFECTSSIREGDNTLLVKVQNDAIYMGNDSWGQPEEGDKLYAATNLGWDDPAVGWQHCPPGFGIYQDVFVEARAPMHIFDLWVRPLPDGARAEAWVEIWNQDRRNRPASVEISVFGQNFRQTVISRLLYTPRARIVPGVGDLQKPTDNQDVTLTMGAGSNLIKVPLAIPHPRRWDLQTPWLYQMQVRLLDESGRVLDAAKRQFGMRSFRQENDKVPRGRMFLNGREIKLRGANTMGFEQQDVFRKDFRQLVDDILLAKICNMNYLRLTQRPVQPEVYEYCDRLGLMTQTDLPLFGCLRYNKFAEAIRQAEEMERLVRGHACNIMISYINEPFPNASGKPHRHLTRPDLQAFFAAADGAVRVVNPDRVVKHVEGDYDPPSETLPDNHCYCGWYNGHGLELGRLHRGFWVPVAHDWLYACGEFGAEGLDPADLMRRRYPRQWLPGADESSWSPDSIPGAQTGKFHYMWFDTQHTLEDWVRVSQRHQAWATRMFAERFRRDNRMVSFAIHLFIDAFPASWMKSIMDCERRPKPAYFAYRDALEPLTVSIRTDRWAFTSGEAMKFEFWISNDTPEAPKVLRLRWQIEERGHVIFAQQAPAVVESTRATFQGFFALGAPHVGRRTKYTLRLALAHGETILRNTDIEYEVFPPLPSLGEMPVRVIGTGKAQQLLRELGGKPNAKTPSVILVDDFASYARHRDDIDRAVADGGRAVFLELPVGEYDIGGSKVRVEECVMRPRQFVSRATGHRLVSGFEPEDFRCWYDPKADYFRPLLARVFDAEGWQAILTSGNGIWGTGTWDRKFAAAEKPSGNGAYIICQVELAGRTRHNPVAAIFARRLLER
jgi:Glycosyl hydrolases family 2, sugar binding domain/Glycosyl hydrolases family 2/Glycosyl hydrolases family 2, TIM barrel domain